MFRSLGASPMVIRYQWSLGQTTLQLGKGQTGGGGAGAPGIEGAQLVANFQLSDTHVSALASWGALRSKTNSEGQTR